MPALTRNRLIALLATIALLAGVVAVLRLTRTTPTATTQSTTQTGPILYVTNLTPKNVAVTTWDGATPLPVAPGMGIDLPRTAAPSGPWHVRVTDQANGSVLYDASLGDGPPRQIQLTDSGSHVIDLVGANDGPEGSALPPDVSPQGVKSTAGAFAQIPNPDTSPSPDTSYTSSAFNSWTDRTELASGLIPPNRPGCDAPKGRVVIANWGTLSYADQGGATGPTDVDLPSPTGDAAYQFYGDPQIVRLKDGDLVYERVVGLFTTIMPKPAWFSYNNSYWRGGLALYRSHCGNDWKLTTLLDANAPFGGKCAWPQASGDQHWFGGFDRPQLNVDPQSGLLFASMVCTGGTAPVFPASHVFDHTFVLTWNPDTGAWSDSGQVMDRDAPAPTTSSAARLGMFHCQGWGAGVPVLFASANSGGTFDVGSDLTGGDPSITCQSNPRDLTKQLGYYSNAPDYGVVRTGVNSERVVYPSVIGGRQGLRVADVSYSGGNFPNGLTQRPTIMSGWSDGNIGHFSLIEEDSSYPAFGAQDQHAALLAWTEYSPSKKLHRERALLFHGETQVGNVIDLSAGGWTLKDVTTWGGDYEYGSFGYWNNACQFVVPWNASKDGTATYMYIHDAIVSDPTCANGASATPIPSPSATATATATATASSAFSVASITLSMQTCSRTGSGAEPWVCPLTGHFALKPGAGGSLNWQVQPSVIYHGSCGETSDTSYPAQPQPSATVTANQTSIDVTGQLLFPDSEVPQTQPNKAAQPATHVSMAHAFSGNVVSPDVSFVSDAGCKP